MKKEKKKYVVVSQFVFLKGFRWYNCVITLMVSRTKV